MAHDIQSLCNLEHSGPVWRYFAAISDIPRPSRHEHRVRDYLIAFATSKELEYRRDAAGNTVVIVPGRGALHDCPVLILQGHTDMVCEKNSDSNHDFMADPIALRTDGEWVWAKETTLGADNGIAVAMMLALIDALPNDCVPLELLFTIDEETGLTGAMDLEPDILTGRSLLNLDSEDDSTFTIGCAGGIDMIARFQCLRSQNLSKPLAQVRIRGFRGGHSGINIHENRGNAIIAAAMLANNISKALPDAGFVSVDGGNKKNAIPRECTLVIATDDGNALQPLVDDMIRELQAQEPDVRIECDQISGSGTVSHILRQDVFDFLMQIPNGVIDMDPAYPDIVRTSSSIGVIATDEDVVEVLIHGRSSSRPELDKLTAGIRTTAEILGGSFEVQSDYPGWTPNPASKILLHGMDVYERLFGKPPSVQAIHAGLESGILGDKLGTNELLSYGPTIENAHAPTERVKVRSVADVYRFLRSFVSTQWNGR